MADKFDGFFSNIRRRLENESFFERLIDPFQQASMPEIWDDPLARAEFEESFFRYLKYVATLKSRPRVPGIVLAQLPDGLEWERAMGHWANAGKARASAGR